MLEKINWINLSICGLACFRLAILISEDDGPARIFQRFRSFLKREAKHNVALRKSDVHHGIECFRCGSIWLAFPIAIYGFNRESMSGWFAACGDVFLLWMALSGLAILMNRAFPKK